ILWLSTRGVIIALKEGGFMNSNTIIVNNIKLWLQDNQKSQQWLAQKIGVSKALVGHMLNESRVIQPQRIVAIAKVLGVSVNELTTDASMRDERMTVELRGTLSNRRSKMELERLKFAVEDYIGLKSEQR
ncbi:helix-turn-helix transcriptional regulator, partial [Exiguobacterium sp. SH31]|uniref:helix-turn-helix domain-containing protein n=2 Tax=unclassified Exiguobacterium TaxID=2644629 RepID=UPI002074B4CD